MAFYVQSGRLPFASIYGHIISTVKYIMDHFTYMGTILPVDSKSEPKHYIVVTSVSRFPNGRDVIAVTGSKSINKLPWDAPHAVYTGLVNEWLANVY